MRHKYSCGKVEEALVCLSPEEIESICSEGKDIEVACQFCDRTYSFTPEEIMKIKDASRES